MFLDYKKKGNLLKNQKIYPASQGTKPQTHTHPTQVFKILRFFNCFKNKKPTVISKIEHLHRPARDDNMLENVKPAKGL
jgi:hypothetical protein